MAALLAEFSVGQIILFIVLAALAFKAIIDFLKWLSSFIKEKVHKEEKPEKLEERLEKMGKIHYEEITKLQQKDEELQKSIDEVNKSVNLLIESDKSAILAWITQRHHHFISKGWIDDFSLLTIEKRFKYYKEEGGNTFAEDLVVELRKLPKKPPQTLES